MKTKKLSNLHFQLTQLGLVNAFLIAEDDGFTLIDTCVKQAGAIAEAAKQLGRPIRRIALTHAHTDHAWSVDALISIDPSLELLVSHREARLLSGDHSLDPDEPALKLRGDFVHARHRPKRLLTAGETVGSLRVVLSPGHTPGHIAFLDERDGTLFAGDAFSLHGGIAVAGDLRVLFPFPALGTWSADLAVASAETLCALGPNRLCVGHGDSMADPEKAMQSAIQRALASRSTAPLAA
jgi:glyoxylase-like metal-dependent hydrolase (beta-lactamase superfamily II)